MGGGQLRSRFEDHRATVDVFAAVTNVAAGIARIVDPDATFRQRGGVLLAGDAVAAFGARSPGGDAGAKRGGVGPGPRGWAGTRPAGMISITRRTAAAACRALPLSAPPASP